MLWPNNDSIRSFDFRPWTNFNVKLTVFVDVPTRQPPTSWSPPPCDSRTRTKLRHCNHHIRLPPLSSSNTSIKLRYIFDHSYPLGSQIQHIKYIFGLLCTVTSSQIMSKLENLPGIISLRTSPCLVWVNKKDRNPNVSEFHLDFLRHAFPFSSCFPAFWISDWFSSRHSIKISKLTVQTHVFIMDTSFRV